MVRSNLSKKINILDAKVVHKYEKDGEFSPALAVVASPDCRGGRIGRGYICLTYTCTGECMHTQNESMQKTMIHHNV